MDDIGVQSPELALREKLYPQRIRHPSRPTPRDLDLRQAVNVIATAEQCEIGPRDRSKSVRE
jgi:hypothetical protein